MSHQKPGADVAKFNQLRSYLRHSALIHQTCERTTDWGAQSSRLGSLDIETGEVRWFKCVHHGASQRYQSPSPDGRWIVMDQPSFLIGGVNGLSLVDQQRDVQLPLCQLNCSGSTGLRDDDGQPIKSETLHPNPSWSPDGRYVLMDSDFGTGISQVYAVDMATWRPRGL